MKPFARFPGGALPARIAGVVLLLSLLATAARAGQVRGRVAGPDHQPLPGVSVTLANDLTGYSQTATSDKDGAFRFTNVPDNPYHLRAELEGFRPAHADLDVRGNIPVEKSLELAAGFAESTTVTAEKEAVALEIEDSSTHTDIDKSLVRRFPAAVASRAF